jgi:hypothetical protein
LQSTPDPKPHQLCVGLFGGSILAPLAYLDDQIAALPSFGLGALVS